MADILQSSISAMVSSTTYQIFDLNGSYDVIRCSTLFLTPCLCDACMFVLGSATSTMRASGRHHDGLAGPFQLWLTLHISYFFFAFYGTACQLLRRTRCIEYQSRVVRVVLFRTVILCSCLLLYVLFCLVTSCLVLCHAVLARIALFLCFTVPYSMPFSAMCYCNVRAALHTAPAIHSFVDFASKPYVTVVFLYIR